MNQCPVCKKSVSHENNGLCHKCGWDLNYYHIGMTQNEEIRFKKKLKIARRNWNFLVSSVKENRALKKRFNIT
jgi:predicted amidophosphoribosyltransferase